MPLAAQEGDEKIKKNFWKGRKTALFGAVAGALCAVSAFGGFDSMEALNSSSPGKTDTGSCIGGSYYCLIQQDIIATNDIINIY